MAEKEEIMNILNLLAGAAQAGAQGVLAQAAFNLMKATEAKVKAEKLQNASMQSRAEELIQETRKVFLSLVNDEAALTEGKQDILNAHSVSYDPAKKI